MEEYDSITALMGGTFSFRFHLSLTSVSAFTTTKTILCTFSLRAYCNVAQQSPMSVTRSRAARMPRLSATPPSTRWMKGFFLESSKGNMLLARSRRPDVRSLGGCMACTSAGGILNPHSPAWLRIVIGLNTTGTADDAAHARATGKVDRSEQIASNTSWLKEKRFP